MFNPVAPYQYLLPNLYLSVADIANPDLFACNSRTWISVDNARFYEEHCQPSSGFAWPAAPKHGNRAPLLGGGRGRHNLHNVCQTAVTAPPRVGCVVWSLSLHFIGHFHIFFYHIHYFLLLIQPHPIPSSGRSICTKKNTCISVSFVPHSHLSSAYFHSFKTSHR